MVGVEGRMMRDVGGRNICSSDYQGTSACLVL